VTSINGSELTLQTKSGVQKLSVSSDTTVFKDVTLAATSSIAQGDALLVIGKPSALYVKNVDPSSVADTVSGSIVKIYKDLNSVVIKDDAGQMKSYSLATLVSYNDQDVSAITMDQLSLNYSVQLLLMSGKVTSVTRLGSGSESSNEGTIYEVDLDHGLLTLQTSSGAPQVFTISSTTSVTYTDQRATGIND
jgi:hypothetical protein